jgi:hypothetical protein
MVGACRGPACSAICFCEIKLTVPSFCFEAKYGHPHFGRRDFALRQLIDGAVIKLLIVLGWPGARGFAAGPAISFARTVSPVRMRRSNALRLDSGMVVDDRATITDQLAALR